MSDIKFGTDGWRAIIAEQYTNDNVARVAHASAQWLIKTGAPRIAVVGHDCRFGGNMFAEVVASVLAVNGIKVILSDRMVSTPMISLATRNFSAGVGIVITASHNPPSYNGYKLKAPFGGPMPPDQVAQVEALIPEKNIHDLAELTLGQFVNQGLVELTNIEQQYIDQIEANFDLDSIRENSDKFAYDPMFGAGQDVMKKLLPNITYLHAEHNPSFNGTAPEPIHRNLSELSNLIASSNGNIHCGLATDGDADRIGLYNSKGKFVDSHHIILLLIKYLVEEKGLSGKVVNAFSVSPRVRKMCEHFGLEYQVVKIGFKYVAEIMVKDDVLLGGEESGGIAIKTHIPERDGIWMGLTVWEYMVKSGKTLEDLINDAYEIVGPFSFERIDLKLSEEQKERIMKNCASGNYLAFGDMEIERSENIDGYKYFFKDDQWVMIRPSGTEPVLRTYAESSSSESAFDILKKTHDTLLNEG
ncbi:MAG: phosphoglucomutase/phosphomannomutase family protein [Vicingaceae bacterium]